MNRCVFFSFIIAFYLLASCGLQPSSDLRLIGGESLQDSSPYVKQVIQLIIGGSSGQGSCSGTLVGPNSIVTAAHCLKEGMTVQSLQMGVTPSPVSSVSGFKSAIHPRYDGDKHDIALVTFSGSIPNIVPMPIGAPTLLQQNANIIYVGYGARTDNEQGQVRPLQSVSTTIQEIDASTNKFLDPGNGNTHCYGDSGGPVIIQNALIGVISAGTDGSSCERGRGINIDLTKYQGWMKCTFEGLGASVNGLQDDESKSDCTSNSLPNPSNPQIPNNPEIPNNNEYPFDPNSPPDLGGGCPYGLPGGCPYGQY